MSDVVVNSNFSVVKDPLRYTSLPSQFRVDLTNSKGPTPGAITASLVGTVVDFSQLVQPGLCRICNLDPNNTVIVGIGDGVEFYPFMDIPPGEFYVFRVSRFLGRSMDESMPGTGTFDTNTYSMIVKAEYAPCNVTVDCFDT